MTMAAPDWVTILKTYDNIPELNVLKAAARVEVEEERDGLLNHVLRLLVRSSSGTPESSVIIKQSVPYVKCLGEGYPLGVERIDIEYKGLKKYYELCPGCVPKPFLYHEQTNSVCMEDLAGYELLRTKLVNRDEFNMDTARTLAAHIGTVHRETHIATLGADRLEKLDQEFENSNMVALNEKFIYVAPFDKDEKTNSWLPALDEKVAEFQRDETVKAAANDMLKLFSGKKECLVHGDFHTGSAMVKNDDVKIIDLEFSYVGPAAQDIGNLLANYIFAHHRHMSIPEDNDNGRKYAYWILDVCKVTVETYLSHMTACSGDREVYVRNLLSEIAGFAGIEICRRLIGPGHVSDLEGLPHAQLDALGSGVRLLHAYQQIHSIDKLLVIALALTY